ncbi:MAG: hypothetical protein MHM6MM_001540 [Cercozoa sp. M6MM]
MCRVGARACCSVKEHKAVTLATPLMTLAFVHSTVRSRAIFLEENADSIEESWQRLWWPYLSSQLKSSAPGFALVALRVFINRRVASLSHVCAAAAPLLLEPSTLPDATELLRNMDFSVLRQTPEFPEFSKQFLSSLLRSKVLSFLCEYSKKHFIHATHAWSTMLRLLLPSGEAFETAFDALSGVLQEWIEQLPLQTETTQKHVVQAWTNVFNEWILLDSEPTDVALIVIAMFQHLLDVGVFESIVKTKANETLIVLFDSHTKMNDAAFVQVLKHLLPLCNLDSCAGELTTFVRDCCETMPRSATECLVERRMNLSKKRVVPRDNLLPPKRRRIVATIETGDFEESPNPATVISVPSRVLNESRPRESPTDTKVSKALARDSKAPVQVSKAPVQEGKAPQTSFPEPISLKEESIASKAASSLDRDNNDSVFELPSSGKLFNARASDALSIESDRSANEAAIHELDLDNDNEQLAPTVPSSIMPSVIVPETVPEVTQQQQKQLRRKALSKARSQQAQSQAQSQRSQSRGQSQQQQQQQKTQSQAYATPSESDHWWSLLHADDPRVQLRELARTRPQHYQQMHIRMMSMANTMLQVWHQHTS